MESTRNKLIKKYSKTRKRVCVYERFNIFKSFFGKYRGIRSMFLFKKDEKVILLIGEQHKNEEREGFTRFSSVVNDLFDELDDGILEKSNSTLDFFFEMKSQELNRYRNLRDDLTSKNKLKFDGRELDIDGKGFDLHMLRVYFSHYVPTYLQGNHLSKKNIRFHFSDYVQPNSTIEDISKIYSQYSQLFTETAHTLRNPEEFNKMVDITKLLNEKTISLYYASLNEKITNRKLAVTAINLFFEDMKEAYSVKHDKFSRHGCDKLKPHFIKCMTNQLNTLVRTNQRLFWLYRSYMDFYSVCRMMRTEANYYKNIVYYAGNNHVSKIHCILRELGFEKVDVDGFNTFDLE